MIFDNENRGLSISERREYQNVIKQKTKDVGRNINLMISISDSATDRSIWKLEIWFTKKVSSVSSPKIIIVDERLN